MLIALTLLMLVLVTVATVSGILLQEQPAPIEFLTARGETVQLYGAGLYRLNSLFSGANYRAQDIVALAVGVPALGLGLALYLRGSVRGAMILAGVQGAYLYIYASMALMAAFNPFFLVYVAALSASFFGLVLNMRLLEKSRAMATVAHSAPRAGPAVFMFACGAVTAFVWMVPLLSAQLSGALPDHLDHYTTMVTDALDLAFITPGTIVCGALILNRRALGYVLSLPLLGTIILLVPLIVGGTVSQLSAGIELTPAEFVGPVAGFAVLGVLAVLVLTAILRRAPKVRGLSDA